VGFRGAKTFEIPRTRKAFPCNSPIWVASFDICFFGRSESGTEVFFSSLEEETFERKEGKEEIWLLRFRVFRWRVEAESRFRDISEERELEGRLRRTRRRRCREAILHLLPQIRLRALPELLLLMMGILYSGKFLMSQNGVCTQVNGVVGSHSFPNRLRFERSDSMGKVSEGDNGIMEDLHSFV